jgi:UDP-N-acetylglucosamine 2-epimerase (non-hydrolysing)
MKIMTILGTRPEIIRLSRVIPLLDQYADHVLVHTGQNYDDRLSDLFFRELGVRAPDARMGVRGGGFGEQAGQILAGSEALFLEHRPDRVLILGDTNSGLSAIVAARLGIPVFHMEAGNRCYDDRVPEEVNRRAIDHASTVLMPYTERSRANLLREGIAGDRIFVTGNPISQVLDHYAGAIDGSRVHETHGLTPRGYVLVTMHRAENVDVEPRLRSLLTALSQVRSRTGKPVICSLHPRTRSRMAELEPGLAADVIFLEPLGLFDFVRLERDAFCILSDSGTVQEEACIFGIPNVTIREVTERPETVECGSNILAGSHPDSISAAVDLVTREARGWRVPEEYTRPLVAETVCRILTGYRLPALAEAEWRERSAPGDSGR